MTTPRSPRRRAALSVATLVAGLALTGCGGDGQPSVAPGRITVANCGEQVSFPSPARRLVVNQGNRIATILALRAADRVAAVSGLGDDRDVLGAAYGTDLAGARNALGDLQESWTSVSWERVVAAKPDFIAFVDYGRQSFEDEVEVLRTNPATKDLPAVVGGRFPDLPFAVWTSSPLNVDAAEHLRAALESRDLLPRSDVRVRLDLPR